MKKRSVKLKYIESIAKIPLSAQCTNFWRISCADSVNGQNVLICDNLCRNCADCGQSKLT